MSLQLYFTLSHFISRSSPQFTSAVVECRNFVPWFRGHRNTRWVRYRQSGGNSVRNPSFHYDKPPVSLRLTPSHEIINMVVCDKGLTGRTHIHTNLALWFIVTQIAQISRIFFFLSRYSEIKEIKERPCGVWNYVTQMTQIAQMILM